MEGITHRNVTVNGINMHIAEKGQGPLVLLLHGFPELWYSWRHQILALASWGYRAVAPDLRGYGDTDAPPSIESYNCLHIVGDIVDLIDSLEQDKVFVVGHDWGAMIAWYLCLFRPDRVKAFVNLGIPFFARNPTVKIVDGFRHLFGDEHYICRFQEPGKIEAEFTGVDAKTIFKGVLTIRDPAIVTIPKIMTEISKNNSVSLPSWLSEDDIEFYASKYKEKGFTGPLNYYRVLNQTWELTAPWTRVQVKVPTKFIVGDLDLVYHIPGMKDYIHSGAFKKDVPLLEEIVIMEGVGHFINQERANAISTHIHDYIQKF